MPNGGAGSTGVRTVLVSLTIAALAVAGCGGGGKGKATQSPTASGSATALTKGGSDLVALLAKGRKSTWHAKYTLTAGGAESGAKTLLELWVKSTQQRQETTQLVGDTVVSHSEAFELATSTVTCSQQNGTGPWLCTGAAATNNSDLLSQAGSQLKGVSVAESNDVLSGRQVTCFQATITGQATKLCLTSDGIPALYVTGQAQMQLTSLDRNVPASAFKPPAPVKSAAS